MRPSCFDEFYHDDDGLTDTDLEEFDDDWEDAGFYPADDLGHLEELPETD